MAETHVNMFFGIVLKPEKRYQQEVETPFHVSKACLEPNTGKPNEVTSVFVEVDDEEFIVCNLNGKNMNENLDLNFNTGDKVCFKTNGTGVVHITGYNLNDDEEGGFEDYSDLEEEESESETEDVPALVNGKKRKNSDELSAPAKKSAKSEPSPLDKILAKRQKDEETKKALEMQKKMAEVSQDDEDSDEDDSDEDDDEEEESEDDDESGEEEEEENDDEDDSEEDEESDEEMDVDPKVLTKKEMNGSPAKKQMNGTPAKKEKQTPVKKEKQTPIKKEVSTPKTDSSAEKSEEASAKKKKNKNKNKENETTPQKGDKPQDKTPGKTPKRTLKGGIVCEDLKVGNGPEAKRGKMVGMYYEGKLKSNGKTFDSTLNGKPFRFRLGSGEVIKGWDVGIDGMKVGGKRRLTIPPQMAYGSKGAGGDIPPNAHLVFEVECKAVN